MKKILLSVFLVFSFISVALCDVYVNGYYKKDGTYVEPHYRSNPDGNQYNNWSTKGNVNPYTGEEGRKNIDNTWQNSNNNSWQWK